MRLAPPVSAPAPLLIRVYSGMGGSMRGELYDRRRLVFCASGSRPWIDAHLDPFAKAWIRIHRVDDAHVSAHVTTPAEARTKLRLLREKGLHDAVQGKPVANDNDPHVTSKRGFLHWHSKVQSAWVRRASERRAGGAS